MPNINRNFFIWAGVFLVLMLVFNAVGDNMNTAGYQKLTFSEFLAKVEAGEVSDVSIKEAGTEKGGSVSGHMSGGVAFVTNVPEYPALVDKLTANNVQISVVPNEGELGGFWGMVLSWFPLLLFIGVYVFFMRQMQGGRGGGAMGFGKSKARLLNEKTERKMFSDVAGADEAKEELLEVVDFLKDPAKFQKLGGKIPKGCLLVGPPGTGKTLLARAIAGEAGVPFFTISGSDFVEMFVGVGASRVRDMFEQGKKNAPCIIFIDEIDAVGRSRGVGLGGGNDEREQTLNQLLVEMDGFESNEGVILIAATNRPDVLDPALLRPGRFDRQIVVPNPDVTGREAILNVHCKKVPLSPDVDVHVIARGTPGFSGADLANLINEAALLAARRDKKVVTMRELEEAKDKVMMGVERKSMVMSEEEKKMTAYHESGHAIVSLHCPASDPIHKATIIPRGRALGMVMRLPEADKLSYHRDKMYDDLAVAMGGRVAEELIFGYNKVSSGASSDIKYATRLARAMVAEWGMSDELGPVLYGSDSEENYLGMGGGGRGAIASTTQARVDAEVRRIVQEAHDRARSLLEEYREELERLAIALLEYETLSGDEIKIIITGEPLKRESATTKIPKKIRSSLPRSSEAKEADATPVVEGDAGTPDA
jgi:cell division protease FtsH